MIKTYCGKSCEQCAQKQFSDCAGCTSDSEKGKSSSCIVASCCEEKQHSSCWQCGSRDSCVNYHSVMTPHAAMLGRYITVLFWLIAIDNLCF